LILEKGGKLYIWIDGAGMKHVHPHPPGHEVAWSELSGSGIEVFVDPGIDPPPTWVIVLHHVPYRHVDALWDGDVPGVPRDLW
jgi:hypothetical protein